jgi:serine O-acetyltransferase
MEFSALGFHRLAYRLWKWHVPLIPRMIDALIFVIFKASIPYNAEIGEGTSLMHRGVGVMMGFHAQIGKGVVFGPYVFLGTRITTDIPIIEDEVVLGAHSKILGGVTIGRGAIIGAGAIVVEDIPPRAVVIPDAARIVQINSMEGKEYFAIRREQIARAAADGSQAKTRTAGDGSPAKADQGERDRSQVLEG